MAKSNQGATKLLQAMKKLIREINDQEICRRLEILINSEKDDLPQILVKKIFESPGEVEPRVIPEPYTQYVMHYLFMTKRDEREREKIREREQGLARKGASPMKPSATVKKSSKKKSSQK